MAVKLDLRAGVPRLIFDERISESSEPAAEEAYEKLSAQTDRFVVVLEGSVTFDSSGLSILLSIITRAEQDRLRLAFAVAAAQTLSMLNRLDVARYVRLYPSLEEAIESLS